MNIDDYITRLENEIKSKIEEIERIKILRNKFPDIKIHYDRFNSKTISSEMVNTVANDVEIKHSCSCCPDAILYATPIYKDSDIQICGTVNIPIGEQNAWGSGDRLDKDWERYLRKQNISEIVIDKIKKYEKEHPPIDEDDEEDA